MYKALLALHSYLVGRVIQVATDNGTGMFYLNVWSKTASLAVCHEAASLCGWHISNHSIFQAIHLAGAINYLANLPAMPP